MFDNRALYLEKCTDCPFGGPRVGYRGNPKSKIAIVGESYGSTELRKGEPFVGDSGKVLWSIFPGMSKEDIDEKFFILNALQCKPPKRGDNPQVPLAKGAKACNRRLLNEVAAHPRDIVIALGNAATWSLTGNYKLKITQDRGNPIPSPLARYGILPAVHPAALMRGTGSYRQFKQDVRYAVEIAETGEMKSPIVPRYYILDTPGAIKAVAKHLLRKVDGTTDESRVRGSGSGSVYLAGDIETTGFDRRDDEILCIGFAWDPHQVFIIPNVIIHDTWDPSCPEGLLQHLLPIFDSYGIQWIWHNGKFDTSFLNRPIPGLPARVDEDTMLLSYALDENPGVHDLEQVSAELLGAPDYKYVVDQYIEGKGNKGNNYGHIPEKVLYEYLSLDVSNTLQNWEIQRVEVAEDHHLEKLYTKTLLPYSEFLRKVEDNGIYVNKPQVELNREALDVQLREIEELYQKKAGYAINLRSPKQMAELLYDTLGLKLPSGKKTRSTAKDILEKLPKNQAVTMLLEYRGVYKHYSTYVKPLESHTKADGRVYSTFKIHGTRTGRLSSNKPNIQNIPRQTDIKSMYGAPPGRRLLELDLNQAELRSLACLSKDPLLLEIYLSTNRSLHDETAIKFFGPQFTHEHKMRAKAVNFGIVYGRTGPSIAEDFDLPIAEGNRYVKEWYELYKVAGEYIKKCRRAPRKLQTIYTVFGRKKRHFLVSRELLNAMQNEAANFPHQSIANEINLHAAMRSEAFIEERDSMIVNLVHDSTLIETPDDPYVIAEIANHVRIHMEQVPIDWGLTTVPFKAEAKLGQNWGDWEKERPEEFLDCMRDYNIDANLQQLGLTS